MVVEVTILALVGLILFWLAIGIGLGLFLKNDQVNYFKQRLAEAQHGPKRPPITDPFKAMVATQTKEELAAAVLKEKYVDSMKVHKAKLDEHFENKLRAIRPKRVKALLDSLTELGTRLRLFDCQLQADYPLIELEDVTGKPELILLMALNELDGKCSVRPLVEKFIPHNAKCTAAGQRRLRVSQKEIRDTLNEHTSNGELKPIALYQGEQFKIYFLFYINQTTRQLICFEDMFLAWQKERVNSV
jgi:hypothetical protein